MSVPVRIPFNRPWVSGTEGTRVNEVLQGGHWSGDGAQTKRAHSLLEGAVGGGRVLLTTSCTHALEMAALLLNLGPGDEVIFPSFTFVSTVNAFYLHGIRPVFADVREDTLNLDERKVEALLTPRTRAIVPVHYAGVSCEMDPLLALAAARKVAVVEDNAHGLFGSYRGRALGSMGVFATQSFHETKNVSCGEGGALVINDGSFYERAEIIREKGTNRSRFFRGQVDKYTWVDVGSSYLPSELLAAVLVAQLEAAAQIQTRRRAIWDRYRAGLQDWAARVGARLPTVPAHCEQSFHMFYLLMPALEQRTALISHLRARGIQSPFHYLPLHLSEVGRRLGGRDGDCPVTESVSDRLLRLPMFVGLTDEDQAQVIESVLEFR